MTIKITKGQQSTGDISKHIKSKYFCRQLTLIINEPSLKEIVIARFYDTGKVTRCCLWINDSITATHTSGGGMAGGYGHHKQSAAFSDALDNAGIENEQINACGDSAIKKAMGEIAEQLGYSNYHIVDAYA